MAYLGQTSMDIALDELEAKLSEIRSEAMRMVEENKSYRELLERFLTLGRMSRPFYESAQLERDVRAALEVKD